MEEWIDPDRGDWRQAEVAEQRGREEMAGFIVKDSGGGDFELPEPNTYVARCWRVVDLGTQSTVYKGEEKTARKVLISWELLGTAMADGRPFVVSKRYTASLHKKANLTADLESWRGRPFTPDERLGFDISKLVGKPCMLSVVHEPSFDGSKTFAQVKSVMALMKDMVAPQGQNAPYFFHLDAFDEAAFNQLSDGLRETIAKSPEFQRLMSPKRPATAVAAGSVGDMDDDIPF